MTTTNQHSLKATVDALPNVPGVYLMKNGRGDVVYVGKARQLRQRVKSYFVKRQASPKLQVLRDKIHSIEHIITPTEVEALLLEAHLINTYAPRYNTELKDDKSYPLLKISHEDFPRISITRNKTDKKATYYGPFTDATLLREAVKLIHAIFPIRKCAIVPTSPCLYYYLQQCLAPCCKKDAGTRENYRRFIRDIEAFLKGDKQSFIEYLTRRMKDSAAQLHYEEAGMFKNQIRALNKLRHTRYSLADPGASILLSGMLELKKILPLKKVPQKIVCFDVSNIQGQWAVASKVSFFREVPDKNQYRRYKIRSVAGIDDYAMIREAVTRMVRGLKSGSEPFRPDLIVIDGGKGHLNTVMEVLVKEDAADIPCIALAKQCEQVFVPQRSEPLHIPDGSPALNLLKRIRDEAHRFGIQYHRLLRQKSLSRSVLDSIKGIGPVRKKRLLQTYQSIDDLRNAPVNAIASLQGFNRTLAVTIQAALQRARTPAE